MQVDYEAIINMGNRRRGLKIQATKEDKKKKKTKNDTRDFLSK